MYLFFNAINKLSWLNSYRRFWISEYSKIKIICPSIAEQIKIVNILENIGLKIELISSKIENTKEFKKGLLQQMFV